MGPHRGDDWSRQPLSKCAVLTQVLSFLIHFDGPIGCTQSNPIPHGPTKQKHPKTSQNIPKHPRAVQVSIFSCSLQKEEECLSSPIDKSFKGSLKDSLKKGWGVPVPPPFPSLWHWSRHISERIPDRISPSRQKILQWQQSVASSSCNGRNPSAPRFNRTTAGAFTLNHLFIHVLINS